MKGTLKKIEQGWVVEYKVDERTPIGHKSWWETLPLHPDFIEMMETCFTSKFTQEVEFEIVKVWKRNTDRNVPTLDDFEHYAKLTHHSVDTNEMVEDDVEKLQQDAWDNYEHEEGNLYSTTFRNAFKLGYNKAKETLYTDEQARIIWKAGQEYWKTSGASITFEELTESLKQPKQ